MDRFKTLFFVNVLVSVAAAWFAVGFFNAPDAAWPWSGKIGLSNGAKTTDRLDGPSENAGPSTQAPLLVGSWAESLQTQLKAVARNVSKSVVSIVISKDIQVYRTDPFGFFYEPSGTVRRKVGGGSGFFIDKNGLIITNKHVVSETNAEYAIVTSEWDEYVGKVLALDPTNDIAIVRAYTKDGKPLNGNPYVSFISDEDEIQVGNFVLAIGNALAEFQNTLTFGVVSGLNRSIQAQNGADSAEDLAGLIQTDTAINPGNSGGPLIGMDGRVIGMNTAIAAGANGLGFAIPMTAKEVAFLKKSVETSGAIRRPFIGIRYVPITKAIATAMKLPVERGNLVSGNGQNAVVAGSPAEKAGIEAGDILLEADGKPLSSNYTVREALRGKSPGESVTVKIRKKTGEEQLSKIPLASSREAP